LEAIEEGRDITDVKEGILGSGFDFQRLRG
jgi:hypothetical protein